MDDFVDIGIGCGGGVEAPLQSFRNQDATVLGDQNQFKIAHLPPKGEGAFFTQHIAGGGEGIAESAAFVRDHSHGYKTALGGIAGGGVDDVMIEFAVFGEIPFVGKSPAELEPPKFLFNSKLDKSGK